MTRTLFSTTSGSLRPAPRARRGARPLGSIAAALLAGLVLVSCGDDDAGDRSPTTTDASAPAATYEVPEDRLVDLTGQSTVEISVVDNTFEPAYFEVDPGTKVVFRNDGRNEHNVFPVEEGRFEAIETEDFAPGKVGQITVEGSGDIAYYCTIHGTKKLNGQSGVIRIAS